MAYTLVTGEDFGTLALKSLREAFEQARKFPLVVLPTGNTPKELYLRIRQQGLGGEEFQYLNLDQYHGIKFSDPRSYPLEIKKEVLDPLGIGLRPDFIFDAEAPPDQECCKIETAIEKDGGIDICVLGIGENGHIGFNEPYSDFKDRSRLVRLAASTRKANAKFCDPHGGVPQNALTLGLRTIFEARKIILLTNKPDITAKALHGRVWSNIPASILQRHPDVTVVATPRVAAALRLAA